MTAPWFVGGATVVAFCAAWILSEATDFNGFRPVRSVLRWSARMLLIVGILCPPAAAAAFLWIAAKQQDRLQEILQPMLDQLPPTTSTSITP